MKSSIKNLVGKKNLDAAEKNGAAVSVRAVNDFVSRDPDGRANAADESRGKAYRAAAVEIEKASDRLSTALAELVAKEKLVVSESKASVARVKDMTNQMGDQLARVSKILGSDFEGRLSQLERFACALEQLKRLEDDGKLDKLLAALR